jgi:hypothetical protein
VSYRPEPLALNKLATLFRLIHYYGRRGKAARRFFLGIVARTLRHSPRSLRLVIMMLGMYKHFCELHSNGSVWDPWEPPAPEPIPVPAVGTTA